MSEAPAHDAVDRYLNEVCWAMGGTLAQQQAARDELRAHIADAAAEYARSGAGPLDATVATLRDLGAPDTVGRSLRRSRRSAALRRPLAQPDGALLFTGRHERHLPPRALLVALASSFAVTAAIAVAYAWPG